MCSPAPKCKSVRPKPLFTKLSIIRIPLFTKTFQDALNAQTMSGKFRSWNLEVNPVDASPPGR